MTYLSYICTTREGETFITKNYAEALASVTMVEHSSATMKRSKPTKTEY